MNVTFLRTWDRRHEKAPLPEFKLTYIQLTYEVYS